MERRPILPLRVMYWGWPGLRNDVGRHRTNQEIIWLNGPTNGDRSEEL
jgi:hypothetical protein